MFWSSWHALEQQRDVGRFPLVDRIDLREHGRCLHGRDQRQRVALPSCDRIGPELVLEGARFMLDKLATAERDERLAHPERLVEAGVREVTKTVLFPARLLYTLAHGRAATNPEAITWFAGGTERPARALVSAAGRFRERGDLEPAGECAQLLRSGLLPLYQELLVDYGRWLVAHGQLPLARKLDVWRERLGRTATGADA